MNPFMTTDAPAPTENAPLTSANISAMSQEEWGRTFMPSMMDAPADPAPATDTPPATETPRGADGKFTAATDTIPPVTTPAADGDTTPPDAVTEKPPELAPVVLPFAVVGLDGTAVEPAALAGMTVTLKANGSDVQMPLADVVRHAQSAAGASRQANELRATVATRESELQVLQQETSVLEQALVRALTDDSARAALAEQYRAYNAPEAELARVRAEQAATADAQRAAAARTQQESTVVEFHGKMAGVFESLITQFPEVTPQELLGQFNFATAHMAVNGVIPPERYPEVEAYVNQSLSAYAQQRHTGLVALRTNAEKAAKAAEQQALAAKNTMAAAVRPSGTGGQPSAAGKPQITTLKDATAYALGAFGSS